MSYVMFKSQDKKDADVEVLDLDETLTEDDHDKIAKLFHMQVPTVSLWNLITRELVVDKSGFDQEAAKWKHMVTTTDGIDKVLSSKEMTERGITLFHKDNQNSDAVRKKAAEITKIFIANGIVIVKSIEYIRYRLEQGATCIISTSSYEDGAIGFVDALVEQNLLSKELSKRIKYSGTTINWETLKVTHMNVGMNKLRGLMDLRSRIKAVFADDVRINDYGLLRYLCDYSFVIKTAKNKNDKLPPNCVFVDWDEVIAHKDNLVELHNKKIASRFLQNTSHTVRQKMIRSKL